MTIALGKRFKATAPELRMKRRAQKPQRRLAKSSQPSTKRKPTSRGPIAAQPPISLVFLRPGYYLRRVDWRNHLAQRIVNEGLKLGRSRSDQYVGQMVALLRAWRGARTDIDRLLVAEAFPDLYTAWELYQ